jgi:hypothetical protein
VLSVATGTPWLAIPALVMWALGLAVEWRNQPRVPEQPTRLFTFYFIDDQQVVDALVQFENGDRTDWARMDTEIGQFGVAAGRFGVTLQGTTERRREVLTAMRQTSINRSRLLRAHLRSTKNLAQRLRPFDPSDPGAPVAYDSYLEVTVPANQVFGPGDLDWVDGDERDKSVEVAGAACEMTYLLARGKGTSNLAAAAGDVLALCRVEDVHDAADGRAYSVRVFAVYR